MGNLVLTNQQDRYNSGEFVLAQYKGPGQMHNIGSVSGILRQYNMTNYGRGRNGDFFLVHVDDMKHMNSPFIAVNEKNVKTVEKILQLQPKSTVKEGQNVSLDDVLNTQFVELSTPIMKVEEGTKDESEAIAEIQEIARVVTSEGKVLKRSEALSPKDFADMYGFSHYLQVVAKVKSGELLSYRDGNDKMYVYHVED